jgi:effector-binding domain-containing protein
MKVEIVTEKMYLDLYGFSGVAINKNYAATAFTLMDKMWQVVKSNELANKGKNIWVYEKNDSVFAGVELTNVSDKNVSLEYKSVTLLKYAYYKHIGPYRLIKHAGDAMNDEIKRKGFEVTTPYIEIYGHWTNDEDKLETELFMCLK